MLQVSRKKEVVHHCSRDVDKTQKMMLGLAKYLLRLPGSDKLPV